MKVLTRVSALFLALLMLGLLAGCGKNIPSTLDEAERKCAKMGYYNQLISKTYREDEPGDYLGEISFFSRTDSDDASYFEGYLFDNETHAAEAGNAMIDQLNQTGEFHAYEEGYVIERQGCWIIVCPEKAAKEFVK